MCGAKKICKPVYFFLLRLAKVTTALSFIFGAVVVLPYSISEYFDNQKNRRVERTLAFFQQYNSPPIITYRKSLTTAVERYKDKISASAVDEKLLAAVIQEMIKDEHIDSDLIFVLDFYEGLAICVSSSICDEKTSYDLFSRHARELWHLFYPYIVGQRGITAPRDFAASVEIFAKHH